MGHRPSAELLASLSAGSKLPNTVESARHVVVGKAFFAVINDDSISNLYMKTSGPQSNRLLPKFLTVGEVAEMLRVKPRTIYDWVSQRRVPFRKAGDRTVFLLDEILEWTKAEEAT